jgi:hypothetical protein
MQTIYLKNKYIIHRKMIVYLLKSETTKQIK